MTTDAIPESREVVKTTFNIPVELHRRLKYHALTHDTTMNALVREWIANNTCDLPS